MTISEAFDAAASYDLWLVIIGLGILIAALLPRILAKYPLSMPMLLLLLGYIAVALPLGLKMPSPHANGELVERLTELGVIISLMGAGLKIDRPIGRKAWASTWRLLSITMILTIVLASVAGWWVAGLAPATALLFGAVVAPTDPVLATDVQVGSPMRGSDDAETAIEESSDPGPEDEIRFALTSEAGLNDGLAFPFTNMAIAVALFGLAAEKWMSSWLLIDVVYKIGMGIVVGYLCGRFLGAWILNIQAETGFAKSMLGLGALATTLLTYGIAQYLGGYGFLAVFYAAVMVRERDRQHERHSYLFQFSEKSERIVTVGILLALGGAIAEGLFDALNWRLALVGLLVIFVVRPLTGAVAMIGFHRASWPERVAISFFGIRGIGSLYYLSYALNEAPFPGAEQIWALVGFLIVVSIFVHGLTANYCIETLDRRREAAA